MHDVLILGGGVIGLSLAYDLAGHGLRVHVVDRATPGREASWAGAGILPPGSRRTATEPIDLLVGLSHELHPGWAAELRATTGIDTGYRKCGGIYVARDEQSARNLRAVADAFQRREIEIEPLDAASLAAIEPALAERPPGVPLVACYLLRGEGQLRNPWHLRALDAACRARGVDFTHDAACYDFRIEGGRVTAVETAAGRLATDRVCVTAGAWTGTLLERLGLAPAVKPIRGQIVLFALERPVIHHVINEGARYLVPRDDGRVLAGSTEEDAGFEKATTAEAIASLSRLAGDLVPALRDARRERTWAGLRPATADGLPLLGAVPGLANAYVAAGHYRRGLQTSTGTAVVMGQLIRGETPEIDLAPFRVDRFGSVGVG